VGGGGAYSYEWSGGNREIAEPSTQKTREECALGGLRINYARKRGCKTSLAKEEKGESLLAWRNLGSNDRLLNARGYRKLAPD